MTSSESRACSSVTIAVISFVMLAIARCSSARRVSEHLTVLAHEEPGSRGKLGRRARGVRGRRRARRPAEDGDEEGGS